MLPFIFDELETWGNNGFFINSFLYSQNCTLFWEYKHPPLYSRTMILTISLRFFKLLYNKNISSLIITRYNLTIYLQMPNHSCHYIQLMWCLEIATVWLNWIFLFIHYISNMHVVSGKIHKISSMWSNSLKDSREIIAAVMHFFWCACKIYALQKHAWKMKVISILGRAWVDCLAYSLLRYLAKSLSDVSIMFKKMSLLKLKQKIPNIPLVNGVIFALQAQGIM